MNYKKFISIGLLTATISLGACSRYENHKIVYELNQNQSSVELIVGENYSTDIYKVKEPLDVHKFTTNKL